jgi:hypothetical protein
MLCPLAVYFPKIVVLSPSSHKLSNDPEDENIKILEDAGTVPSVTPQNI